MTSTKILYVRRDCLSMNYMIDTNIFLDVMLNRKELVYASEEVLKLSEDRKINGFITASTVTDLYYLLKKYLKDGKIAYEYLGYILDIVSILPVTEEDVLQTYILKARDFEDALLAVCANKNSLDGIITRNIKDFKNLDVQVITPEDFINM